MERNMIGSLLSTLGSNHLSSLFMLSDCHSILSHSADGISLALRTSPDATIIVSISPTSLSYFSSEHINPVPLFSHTFGKNVFAKVGNVKDACWISNTSLAVLTSNHKILIIEEDFDKQTTQIVTVLNRQIGYQCITSLDNYIFAGDQNGFLSILNYAKATSVVHKITGGSPILSICTMGHFIALVDANGVVYTFHIAEEEFSSSQFVPEIERYEMNGSIIIGSKHPFLAAVYGKNQVTITNFGTSTNATFPCENVTALTFSSDHLFIIAVSDTYIYVIDFQRLYISKFSNSHFSTAVAATPAHILVATNTGLFSYPWLFFSIQSLYSRTKICHLVPTADGVQQLRFQVDNPFLQQLGMISHISFRDKSYAVAGSSRIAFLNTETGNWFFPITDQHKNQKITWFGRYVVVATASSLFFYTIGDTFTLANSFKLPKAPTVLSSDSNWLIVDKKYRIDVYRLNLSKFQIKVEKSTLKAEPFSKGKLFCCLLSNHSLWAYYEDSTATEIQQNVSDFFIDRAFEMLYVICNGRLLASHLPEIRLVECFPVTKRAISVVPGYPALYFIDDFGEVEISPLIVPALIRQPPALLKKLSDFPGYHSVIAKIGEVTADPIAFCHELMPNKKLSECGIAAVAGAILEQEGIDEIHAILERESTNLNWLHSIAKILPNTDGIDQILLHRLEQYDGFGAMLISREILYKPLGEILGKHKETDSNVKMMIKSLRGKKDIEELLKEFLAAKWDAWSVACMLVNDQKEEAKVILKKNKKLWTAMKAGS